MSLHKTTIVLIVAFAATMFCGCNRPNASATVEPEKPASPAGPVVRAVYLFNSEACPCERTRNEEAEVVIANVLSGQTEVRPLERVDVAKSPSELERYQGLAQFTVMPVLLGFDGQGRVVNKIEGFLKEPQVASILLPIL